MYVLRDSDILERMDVFEDDFREDSGNGVDNPFSKGSSDVLLSETLIFDVSSDASVFEAPSETASFTVSLFEALSETFIFDLFSDTLIFKASSEITICDLLSESMTFGDPVSSSV